MKAPEAYPAWLRWAHVLLVLLALIVLGRAIGAGQLVDTGMNALLPRGQDTDPAELQAESHADQLLNRQMVLLVGSEDAAKAVEAAREFAARWRESGLFAEVQVDFLAAMDSIRQEARGLQLALLPNAEIARLQDDPSGYFAERAAELANPFGQPSILPVEQDWVGLGRHLLPRMTQAGGPQLDAETGTLQRVEGDTTWVWVHASLREAGTPAGASTSLLPLLRSTQTDAGVRGLKTLMAGGAIFSAEGKASGEAESRWMSAAGLTITLLLLLGVMRSLRVLGVMLPLLVGVLLGLAACWLVFGSVHVLTLVIGTSLVGVLIDLPMHWLAPAVVQPGWRAWPAMRSVVPPFVISLLITVSGYLLLWFTPLPVLQQTALFSAVALCAAFGTTALWLPFLFRRWQPRPVGALVRMFDRILQLSHRLRRSVIVWAVCLPLAGVGLWQSNWQDDIRQWVSVSPQWLAQAQHVARLGGGMGSARQLLVVARDDEDLLARDARLVKQLRPLIDEGALGGVQALSQWVQPLARQRELQALFMRLSEQSAVWAPMQALGVPDETMQAALRELAGLPLQTLPQVLGSHFGLAWQPLHVGRLPDGRVAATLRLDGLKDPAALSSLLRANPDVKLLDRPARLNAAFREARDTALLLKIASWGAAMVLLCVLFGWRHGLAVLIAPLMAAVLTVAVLGWLGVPLSLFAVFGLLLVSAIGIDYAVYAHAGPHHPLERMAGILLAALTSMISFSMLGASATPAVAGFGICVTVGILLNLFLSSWLIADATPSHANTPSV
ncbi:MAG: hypothetical protein Q4D19_03210 [Lautropia sp.]|nr:hypothetical protein [Lautropia sp.]